ncbi:MAG: hypothetical protein Q9199_000163 [Rusavskia elegans]
MSSDRKESVVEDATLKLRQELTGASGPRALVKNIKVFGLACFACLGGGFLAEILSRKYAILVNVGIFVVGVIIQSSAAVAGVSCIIAGRFITGLAIGAMSVNVPNYNAEVAPPEVRGSLVALQQLAITAGIMY